MKFTKLSAFAGAATLVSLLFTGVAAAPASAAPIEASCGYAEEGTGGKFVDSICWFDFAGYDQSIGLTAEGQRFETTLGDYEIAYTVTQRATGMGWQPRSVEARPSTDVYFQMGNANYYDGIPGLPYLYANRGASFGSVQINIVDFEVTLQGVPVTGYDLITAAPETPDAFVGNFGERIFWDSDQPLTMIDSMAPFTTGNGCTVPLIGNGSNSVQCQPAPAGTSGVYGAMLAAPSATSISGTLFMNSAGEREAMAFGIRTSTLTLEKSVDGRVDPLDSFDLQVTSPEGVALATATTGADDSAATAATTVIPSGAFTLSEASTAGAPSPVEYYDAAWECTNNTTGSTTVLPDGTDPSQQLTLVAGDSVDCVVTNTAKQASLGLIKSVSPATASVGDTVVYDFAVTNDGALPVENLVIDETTFTGTGELGDIVCPVTTLAVGESTTCQAPYVVTQADIDAGLISNEATASAGVVGTSAVVTADASTAVLDTPGAAVLDVVKTVDSPTATVGDTVLYTLTATNTGTLTLSNVELTDEDFTGATPLGDLTCDKAEPVTLAPGETLTCTVEYEVDAADVGTVTNNAGGTATDPHGDSIAGNGSAELVVVAAPVVPAAPAGPAGASLAITGGDAPWLVGGVGAILLLVGASVLAFRRALRS
jgi:hypothetical protein